MHDDREPPPPTEATTGRTSSRPVVASLSLFEADAEFPVDACGLDEIAGLKQSSEVCGLTKHWVPIWVVRVDEQVYVRTWHRRDNGWFGQVLESLRARIRVPGLEVDVAIEDIGEDKTELRASIDAAYRVKYGHYGGTSVDRMVTDDAAASTLGFIPEQGHGPVVGGFR